MAHEKILKLYDEHAKQCDPADFLGQVRRTVKGKPVDEAQIDQIIDTIVTRLELDAGDFLLDLCCGNGVASDRVFRCCAGGVGVDIGAYLIDIARKNFGGPNRDYVVSDVEEYVKAEAEPERFSKALCYGSFAYISAGAAENMLRALRARFTRVERVFIGNLPDKGRLHDFFYEREYVPGVENDHESMIGLWRTEDEFRALAASTGWNAEIVRMPEGFYSAHYRYDVVLTPA